MATPRRPSGSRRTARPGARNSPRRADRPAQGPKGPKGPKRGKGARSTSAKPASRPAPRPKAAPRKRKAAPAAPAARAVKLVPRSRELVALEKLVLAALEDMKAVNVKLLDVRGLTDVADTMVVASGNSDRHVRAIAERVIERAKGAGRRPMGTEGRQDAEWVLVDLQDVLVHVMLPRVREFYALEQLWEAPAATRRPEGAEAGA